MTTVWLAIAVGSMALVAQDSTFTRLRVREDIEIRVPAVWRVVPSEMRKVVATVAEAALMLSDVAVPKGANGSLFIAVSPEGLPWAEVRVSAYPLTITGLTVSSASQSTLATAARALREPLAKALPHIGSRVVGEFTARKDILSGYPTLVIEGGQTEDGTDVVLKTQTNRIMLVDQEVVLTFIWQPKEIWDPVIQAIRQSFVIRRK